MTLSNIGIGIAIIAFAAYLELMDKEDEKKRKVFENEI